MNEITVTYWLYKDTRARARETRVYTAEHVNAQLPMLERHMPGPYRVVCVTDDPTGLDPRVEAIDMPCDDGGVMQLDDRFPPCYRKLWNWSLQARKLGRRILSLDLDTVITRRLSPIVERCEPLVVWRNRSGMILGGCYLLDTGEYSGVWENFDFEEGPLKLRAAGLQESDQGWLNWMLPRCVPSFGSEVYLPPLGNRTALPEDAAIVSFGQPQKPWMPEAQQRWPWIKQHYEVAHA